MLNVKSLIKISAGLLLASTIGFAGKAQAQSVDVPFTGTSGTVCTFGTTTAGTLVPITVGGPNAQIMEASAGVTGSTNGTAGKTSVNCTAGGTLTVAAPTPVAVPATFNQQLTQAFVQRGTGTGGADLASANTGGNYPGPGRWNATSTTMPLPAGNSDLNVAMVAGNYAAGIPPTGTYRYTVRLTVVSN